MKTKKTIVLMLCLLMVGMMFIPAYAKAATNGWVQSGSDWYYYENGNLVKGWKYINSHWYYLDINNGRMFRGWLKDSGKWYYFNSIYHPISGFPDGAMLKNGWYFVPYSNQDSYYSYFGFESDGGMYNGKFSGGQVNMSAQGYNQCWFACTQSMLRYYKGIEISQNSLEQLAANNFGHTIGKGPSYNTRIGILKHYGFTPSTEVAFVSKNYSGLRNLFSIQPNSSIYIDWANNSVIGHQAMLTGYDAEGKDMFKVQDPASSGPYMLYMNANKIFNDFGGRGGKVTSYTNAH